MKVAVHSGAFHADDVFAVLVLKGILGSVEVIRTRDPEVIRGCDYVVDVGGEYDPGLGLFDHHQKGFGARRENGVPYAAAGLVWRHFGACYVQGLHPTLSGAQAADVARCMDRDWVQHLDALDTGHRSPSELPASLPLVVDVFNPTWEQLEGLSPEAAAELLDRGFDAAVQAVTPLVVGMIQHLAATTRAAELVRQSPQYADGRIVFIAQGGMPWTEVVCNEMPNALFVVYPSSGGDQVMVRVVPVEPTSFVARKDLPSFWAGLRDAKLAAVSGVPDAVFCHTGQFIACARSVEGALALAHKALQY